MKIISRSKSGNLTLFRRMTKINIFEEIKKISKPGIHVGSKGGNALSKEVWEDYSESSKTIT